MIHGREILGIPFRAKHDGLYSKILVVVRCIACGEVTAPRLQDLRKRAGSCIHCHGGITAHPLYTRWNSMICRCKYPSSNGYEHYGGRGIRVCERWLNFWNFVEDVGVPDGLSPSFQLDRKNGNGDYEPGNVRWATPVENSANKMCHILARTHYGMPEWECGGGV
jgi:hypothetical protein